MVAYGDGIEGPFHEFFEGFACDAVPAGGFGKIPEAGDDVFVFYHLGVIEGSGSGAGYETGEPGGYMPGGRAYHFSGTGFEKFSYGSQQGSGHFCNIRNGACS